MNPWRRNTAGGLGLVALAAAAVIVYIGRQWVSIGTAYEAKLLCSGVFVSHRTAESLLRADLSLDDFAVFRRATTQVDTESRVVTVDLFGIAPHQAVYRDRLGCRIVDDEIGVEADALASNVSAVTAATQNHAVADPWDADAAPHAEPVHARLQGVLKGAFAEPDATRPQHTRAIVIVYRGRLVAERYAPGFDKDTPLLGWSMTKSVLNALVGIEVGAGKLAIDRPLPVPEWQGADDPRRQITLDHLLRMSSGLQFNEDYSSPLTDVAHMLFGVKDMAGYAAAKTLEAAPGTRWQYSSGDTLITARVLRQLIGEADYADFPRHALFDRLGMRSAVIETDATGTFVGSSFMYATARDWARFGLLYLNDGVADGQRILPPGWVTYSRTATQSAPEQQYAAHFWLKLPPEYLREPGLRPLPADAFFAIGHEGQLLTIIPSRQLVVVRLGQTLVDGAWDQHAFVNRVLDAIGE